MLERLRLMRFRIWSGVLVQMKGCLRWFEALMKARILATRSGTEGNTPRRMACRSMIPNRHEASYTAPRLIGFAPLRAGSDGAAILSWP